MDMNVISDEQLRKFNICRCCLKSGCYKNISYEYYYSGEREEYEVMLKNTFDIQFPYNKIQPVSYLICEECITRLRDATIFKNMILQNEDNYFKIVENIKCNSVKDTLNIDEQVKLEDIKCESLDIEPTNDNLDDYDINVPTEEQNSEINANIKMEVTPSDAILDSEAGKNYTLKKKTKLKKSKVNSDKGVGQKDWSKILERRGNGPILRENSLKLLAYSTILVFQWNKSRYRCFCCKEPFSDVDTLRAHTHATHSIKAIEKKIIGQQNRLVKVEISTLNCKLCYKNFENLSLIRTHLTDVHSLSFESEEDLLVPFKIGEELCCQLCQKKFNVFRLLNIHMNKHFRKQVCHICGAGFSNSVFLNLHNTRSHKPFKCRQCDETFDNKTEKKHHEANIHGLKSERKLRFPCPYCSERFFQENFRVLHLVEKHGLKRPEYKCEICLKIFITKSLCNNHLRNVHLKEKTHECDICHNLFYTKSDVNRHKLTHTGEKKFSCALCNNSFTTKDSLKRHMKRTHGLNEINTSN